MLDDARLGAGVDGDVTLHTEDGATQLEQLGCLGDQAAAALYRPVAVECEPDPAAQPVEKVRSRRSRGGRGSRMRIEIGRQPLEREQYVGADLIEDLHEA